jgi:hypothetical protein
MAGSEATVSSHLSMTTIFFTCANIWRRFDIFQCANGTSVKLNVRRLLMLPRRQDSSSGSAEARDEVL